MLYIFKKATPIRFKGESTALRLRKTQKQMNESSDVIFVKQKYFFYLFLQIKMPLFCQQLPVFE